MRLPLPVLLSESLLMDSEDVCSRQEQDIDLNESGLHIDNTPAEHRSRFPLGVCPDSLSESVLM